MGKDVNRTTVFEPGATTVDSTIVTVFCPPSLLIIAYAAENVLHGEERDPQSDVKDDEGSIMIVCEVPAFSGEVEDVGTMKGPVE